MTEIGEQSPRQRPRRARRLRPEERRVTIQGYVDRPLFDAVYDAAWARRRSIASVVAEALAEWLSRNGEEAPDDGGGAGA